MTENNQQNDVWKKIPRDYPPQKPKQCEGENCLNTFTPTGPWGGRRCPRCRKEKRPYKDDANPF